ncbi:MAG: signal recognition particle protein [Gammaproteobacteria bacterium]|nr:MAG: signal recognition particle protein [Gammaproteobacteria bacterium]
MFNQLSDRLRDSFRKLSGRARITEDNINDTVREVRKALLEADVALPVVKQFTAQVKSKALGMEVHKSLSPGQAFIKIVHQALVEAMGEAASPINLQVQPPAVILMAGLQGAGKTTTSAKLALWLKEREKKKVLLVSADVYRPAAIEQLKTLADEVGVECFPSAADQKPEKIAMSAVEYARRHLFDVVIVDTAGRLAIDDAMMDEIKRLQSQLQPAETLFVVDAMTGQDAANTARAFHEALDLTGVVLSKADGDARGGAALSIRAITGKPIKFIGTGEKMDGLEAFHPERIASRILGMGDVLSLIEDVERKIDKKKAEQLAKKVAKGQGFDLEDFREQLIQMKNLGGVGSLLNKLPGMASLPKNAEALGEQQFKKMEAIINSMTPHERRHPKIIKGSRKRRIAAGSGTQIQDVNRMLKQFEQMQKMMKKLGGKGGMKKLMRGMKGMMPPGGRPF